LVVFIKMNTASFLLISVKISNQSFGRKWGFVNIRSLR
jgi:hypothetical protein